MRGLRAEVGEQRLALIVFEHLRRLEQRIDTRFNAVEARFTALEAKVAAVPADRELTLKAELLGRLAFRDTVLDEKLEQLADRIAESEAKG